MPTIMVYVDFDTLARLEHIGEKLGRSVADLADAAVSEAALNAEPSINASRPHRSPSTLEDN